MIVVDLSARATTIHHDHGVQSRAASLDHPPAFPKGPAGVDADRLEKILARVSDRCECVRGEGEWRPTGLPASTGA